MMELTSRLAELAGAKVEERLARYLLRKGEEIGESGHGGLFIPLGLSRQELADMTGTTIETAIRVMSRWAKQDVVATRDDGFVLLDRPRLVEIARAAERSDPAGELRQGLDLLLAGLSS